MPSKRHDKRWEHSTYKWAYVREHRGMACTVIHGSFPTSTGLRWCAASKSKAMAILEQRLNEHLHGQPTARAATRTCADLFEQFVIVRYPKLDRYKRAEYSRYFSFVPADLPVTSTEEIRKQLLARTAVLDYAQNTMNSLFRRIRTVFRFGIEQGWLQVNPVHKDMIPPAQVSTPQPYKESEIEGALDVMTGRSQAFVMFLYATGCRPIEATRLLWEDIYEDHCILWSNKGGSSTRRRRVIPFALCPDALRAIELARGQKWSSSTHVFGTATYVKANSDFNHAVGHGVGRGLYDIRKAAISKWMRLGWPEEVRHAIAGHEKSIAERHYESPYSADELASIVQASRDGNGSNRKRK